MPKNFFRKLKESIMSTNDDGGKSNRSSDFERAKEVLFSVKNIEQLISAVKYINNFNKKYGLGTKSPEFIYFDRMIKVMKVKLRSKRFEVGDNPEDGERMDLRGRIRESLEDLDWIEQSESTFKPGFPFEGKEYWLDGTKTLDVEDREKIVNYIKKVLPNYHDWEGDGLEIFGGGSNKAIIIHCGSDRTNYEPEEGLLCFSHKSYEEDYTDDVSNIPHTYVDGREVLDYINLINDEEELDESLEWTDKDGSFDGKDKSFEADPTWTGDDDWAPNPDRSYWKQGDAGGSGGGDVNESEEDPFKWMKDVEPDELSASPDVFFRSDDEMYYTLDQLGHDITNMDEITMCELAQNYGYRWSDKHEGWYHRDEVSDFRDLNESQDLDWIRDVSDQLPSYNQRTRIDLKDFLLDYAEDNLSVIDFLHNEDLYVPTEDYRRRYTPEEWDEHGTDQWRDGDFKEHGQWIEYPWVTSWDIIEELEMGCSKWEFIDRTTDDYDLERGSYDDLFIFKRKKDGRYFALGVRGDSYNGMDDNEDFLYEVFPRMRLVYESRKNLIKKILRESEWEWAKEIPGTKEYGQEYRYFEIIACYGVDWETDECDDEYSHFVRIPKYEADEIWNIPDADFDYLAGPGDEGEGVIMYAIKNQLISHFDINEIIMFQGVREVDEETGMMHLEESKSINESEWDWLEDTREHANYNGHPQGIVKIYGHDEIDRICDVIDDYNGFDSTTDRSHLHRGLEVRRDELEQMSAEDDFDYGEAMLSVTFFVEKEPKGHGPNALTIGYWPYEVDERDIEEWLYQDDTYNREYELYDSIEQVENLFKL